MAPAHIVAAAMGHCFARRDWVRAEEILGDASPRIDIRAHPELRLRQLELYCYTLRMEQAAALAEVWMEDEVLPAIATGTIAALLGARGQWRRVITLLQDRVDRGMRVDEPPLLQAVYEAARQEDDYASVVTALDLAQARGPIKSLQKLRRALLAECAVRRALGKPGCGRPAERDLFAGRSGRVLAARARVFLHAPVRPAAKQHIFFCADAAYMIGAAIALLSVLRNNLALARECSFWLVCADDDLAFARDLCGVIGNQFGATVTVVPAGKIVPDQALRRDWGLFTPGQMLARSAYWRIFMARTLLAWGAGGRALYLDSDVVAAPGLGGIFRTRLGGRALAARTESRLPEVAEAAGRIGVRTDRYFNSGVLLFDLEHEAAGACLEASIEASLRRQHMLTFHDQCALNIGFTGQSFPLPPRYNMFLRAGEPPPAGNGTAVVRHFLGRPKPWDAIIAGAAPVLWQTEFQLLAELADPALIARLLLGAVQPLAGTEPIALEAAA